MTIKCNNLSKLAYPKIALIENFLFKICKHVLDQTLQLFRKRSLFRFGRLIHLIRRVQLIFVIDFIRFQKHRLT